MGRVFWLALVAIIALPSLAQAHFLWVVAHNEKDGNQTVHAYFAEGADAGEANLIENIRHAKVWVRPVKGDASEVKLTVKKEEEFGLLVGAPPSSATGGGSPAARVECLEAACKYGVITRGEKASLLHYYAKWLAATPTNAQALGQAKELPLDIVPHMEKGKTHFEVLWQGKPAEGSQVIVVDASGEQSKHATQKDGRLSISTAKPGRYAVRARWIEDKGGDENGKAYQQRSHYTTLVLDVPGSGQNPDAKVNR
jgi:hypothetical protein